MHPSDEQIRLRAYQLWEMNGRQDGRDLEYWLQAALELDDAEMAKRRAAETGESSAVPTAAIHTLDRDVRTPRPSLTARPTFERRIAAR